MLLFKLSDQMWCDLLEREFKNCRITDDFSHFRWAIDTPPTDLTFRVWEITVSLNSYEASKVLTPNATAEVQTIQQLLQGIVSANKWASEQLQEMRCLRSTPVDDYSMLS